jgi:DNA-binding NarL/FixJ family response regulator
VTSPIRILVADDQTLFRRSFRTLLEAKGYDVVAEAETSERALELCRELDPDVVLMDLEMPEMGGLEATRRLMAEGCRAQVVVLTGSHDDDRLVDAMQAGAQGYLLKTLEPDRLFELLDGVSRGEPALQPDVAHRALQRIAREGPGGSGAGGGRKDPMELTDREEEVLCWMAGGVTSTRALADKLGVTERTVKFHIGNLLDKLQVGSRAEAVSLALREGMVEPKS